MDYTVLALWLSIWSESTDCV